jgi:hypothetical protein
MCVSRMRSCMWQLAVHQDGMRRRNSLHTIRHMRHARRLLCIMPAVGRGACRPSPFRFSNPLLCGMLATRGSL